MNTFVDQLPQRLQSSMAATDKRKRIILPEAEDSRIIDACVQLQAHGLTEVLQLVLIAPEHQSLAEFSAALKAQHPALVDTDFIQCVSWQTLTEADQSTLTDLLGQQKKYSDLNQSQLEEALQSPLQLASTLLKADMVDGCVAGATMATSDVIRAGLRIVGLTDGEHLISSYFVMDFTDITKQSHTVLFADAAINIEPDTEALVTIAKQTARSAKQVLGQSPSVALLSFSTYGSAQHERVEQVSKAAEKLQTEVDYPVLGEVQFDAALSLDVRAKKIPTAQYHDQPCNVMVFPSLEAGNIGYKIAERIGGATAIGPIIQGLSKPMNDLSRGTSVEAIVYTVLLTALQSC